LPAALALAAGALGETAVTTGALPFVLAGVGAGFAALMTTGAPLPFAPVLVVCGNVPVVTGSLPPLAPLLAVAVVEPFLLAAELEPLLFAGCDVFVGTG
jgi:hypothetical protein